jgi:DNA mismatch repair protein MSH6
MGTDGHKVFFLYKLTQSICAKSFGVNVAKMTAIPDAIIEKAAAQAEAFEQTQKTHDSTYSTNLTPTMLGDIAYLLKPTDLNPRAASTTMNSFRGSDSM